jgi:hypothetical protein
LAHHPSPTEATDNTKLTTAKANSARLPPPHASSAYLRAARTTADTRTTAIELRIVRIEKRPMGLPRLRRIPRGDPVLKPAEAERPMSGNAQEGGDQSVVHLGCSERPRRIRQRYPALRGKPRVWTSRCPSWP